LAIFKQIIESGFMASITFHGAAETVTGSKYLVQADDARVLVDCGLFQGFKALRKLNWESPAFEPRDLDAVVLTHAHLDHVGYLPRLVAEGFRGPIYATEATRSLAGLILEDSARNQERDAKHANRKGYSKHKPAQPLYDRHDVGKALKLFRTHPREQWLEVAGPIHVRLHDAGHLLGSNMIEMELRKPSETLRILFSGDVGRYDAPLYHDPQPPTPCDYLVCESTYGNREHPTEPVLDQLRDVTLRAVQRGGVILVASFAVGRAQQLIYLLQALIHRGEIPRMPIFLDSPMANNATEIYYDHREDLDLAESELQGRHTVLKGPNVHLSRTVQQSKRLNHVQAPAVIISSSGMMTGGRILHHLMHRLPNERNTILLGGFMAAGTRGRRLQDGEPTVRIHGHDIPVRAQTESLSALSGHAGRSELLSWLAPLDKPKRTFITHGESNSAHALAHTLQHERGWTTCVPKMGQSFELS
jgi:metallo-beta-lactamase family protein